MNLPRKAKCQCLILLALLSSGAVCPAFSLLGPYAKWMDYTNGYRKDGDIGGPMNIGQGYRWNVPIVTYAFDQSFLDFFGSNGVSAVEHAIQILNRLPRASSIVLTNYPLSSERENYPAEAQGLYDLKSVTLSLLLEQMGLAEPTRYVYTLRRTDSFFLQFPYQAEWSDWFIPYYIIKRNFDPKTLTGSSYVNGTLYGGYVYSWSNSLTLAFADVEEFAVELFSDTHTAVADRGSQYTTFAGHFYSGFTRDDVGGLRYLLRKETVNYEILLPDVHRVEPPAPPIPGAPPPPPPPDPPGVGPPANRFVNGALRPGVEKITFVRHPYNSRLARASTKSYRFIDTYILNGIVRQQPVERVVTQPDFLFSAADSNTGKWAPPLYERTAASNWWNSVAGSTNADRTGPGVIRPPVKITFRRNPWLITDDSFPAYSGPRFGSFDGSTRPPVAYPAAPISSGSNQMTVRLWLFNTSGAAPGGYVWRLPIPFGGRAILQTSDDLKTWLSQISVTNQGLPVDWYYWRSSPTRFFRVVPD